jgi:hypothetical protein
MTDLGTSIGSAADFSRTAVYLRTEETGPVYAVAFDNPEYVSGFTWESLVFVLLLFAAVPGGIFAAGYGQQIGIPWWVTVLLELAILSAVFQRAKNPHLIPRRIELDVGRNQLNVLRKGYVEESRQLNRLSNLTVEPHPEAGFRRQERIERGEKGLKPEEKQHCLFGWFGAGGAQKVLLVARYEWPNQDSLFEVRQAIQFAREHAAGGTAESTGTGPAGGTAAEDTIPPLD